MLKYFALLLHTALHLLFFLSIESNPILVISLILHLLCFLCTPQCYQNHCLLFSQKRKLLDSREEQLDQRASQQAERQDIKQYRNIYSLQQCSYCGLLKWIRMHHCHRCETCVHKYDHHCVLLGICIGQRNQKFYILFLWAYLYCCIKQLYSYFMLIESHIVVNYQRGYEQTDNIYVGLMILVIFYFLASLIMLYLTLFHTYLVIYNDTTYQRRKGFAIWYFRGLEPASHPFDSGILTNLYLTFIRAGNQPIQWWNPSCRQNYSTLRSKQQ